MVPYKGTRTPFHNANAVLSDTLNTWVYSEIADLFSPSVASGKIAEGSYVACGRQSFWGVVLEVTTEGVVWVKSHQTGRRRKVGQPLKIPTTNQFLKLKSTGEWYVYIFVRDVSGDPCVSYVIRVGTKLCCWGQDWPQ